MMKPERIPWQESNLSEIGSDLDHKIKQAAAAQEDAWEGINTTPGLRIWRIEQFRVVPWPKTKYGTFYNGDSYIVMNTFQKEGSDALYYDVHIWIGSQSSQDEYGTAAYKMVESDDYVNGAAIQHREVEGYESEVRVYKHICVLNRNDRLRGLFW
jgi:gelsolin